MKQKCVRCGHEFVYDTIDLRKDIATRGGHFLEVIYVRCPKCFGANDLKKFDNYKEVEDFNLSQ